MVHQRLIYNLRNLATYNLAILRFLIKSKNDQNNNRKALLIFKRRV